MKHLYYVLFTISSLIIVTADTNDVVKSSCSSTLHPAVPELASKVRSPKDVIELSINLTISAAQQNHATIIEKLAGSRTNTLTVREKTALQDCLETTEETLEQLHQSVKDLQEYYSSSGESVSDHAEDLKALLSAAMTNQGMCIDGFSPDEAVLAGQLHVSNMCSNVLAMIKNLVDTDMARLGVTGRDN